MGDIIGNLISCLTNISLIFISYLGNITAIFISYLANILSPTLARLLFMSVTTGLCLPIVNNHFCAFYVIRTNLGDKFNLTVHFLQLYSQGNSLLRIKVFPKRQTKLFLKSIPCAILILNIVLSCRCISRHIFKIETSIYLHFVCSFEYGKTH